MKILFLATVWDPARVFDPLGVTHFMVEGLKQCGHQVTVIDLQHKHRLVSKFYGLIARMLPGKPISWPSYNKYVANLYEKEIAKYPEHDMLFTFGSLIYPYLNSNLPKVCWPDATFDGLYNAHKHLQKWPKKFAEWLRNLDKKGLEKCSNIIFASQWAADTAINGYSLDQNKISIVAYGGNLPSDPDIETVSKSIDNKISEPELNLLFIGYDWEFKNGPVLFEILRDLLKLNPNAKLNIVGAEPKVPDDLRESVIIYGKINKNIKEEWDTLKNVFYDSHFFIMLSQHDTFGHVYCEASAFGVPSIAYSKQGIKEVVQNNVNGYAFPYETNTEEITNYIFETYADKELYKKLCHSSRKRYETELNWKVAAQKVDRVISAG